MSSEPIELVIQHPRAFLEQPQEQRGRHAHEIEQRTDKGPTTPARGLPILTTDLTSQAPQPTSAVDSVDISPFKQSQEDRELRECRLAFTSVRNSDDTSTPTEVSRDAPSADNKKDISREQETELELKMSLPTRNDNPTSSIETENTSGSLLSPSSRFLLHLDLDGLVDQNEYLIPEQPQTEEQVSRLNLSNIYRYAPQELQLSTRIEMKTQQYRKAQAEVQTSTEDIKLSEQGEHVLHVRGGSASDRERENNPDVVVPHAPTISITRRESLSVLPSPGPSTSSELEFNTKLSNSRRRSRRTSIRPNSPSRYSSTTETVYAPSRRSSAIEPAHELSRRSSAVTAEALNYQAQSRNSDEAFDAYSWIQPVVVELLERRAAHEQDHRPPSTGSVRELIRRLKHDHLKDENRVGFCTKLRRCMERAFCCFTTRPSIEPDIRHSQ
ncbi:hypothetical protein BDQ17DRAFT_1361518 [Cyathus striatus]|nr:hypothetical protein BDQ17DRAFT_1361518 [Cyathus striatus]